MDMGGGLLQARRIMRLKMAEKSLFAILLRSPWWVSILLAAVLGLTASAILPREYSFLGASAGFPVLVIGIIAAWKQLHAPSSKQINHARQSAANMSWNDFSELVKQAYRSDGYEVVPHSAKGADFEIIAAGGKSLVSCKRWKAASTGVEPLRELQAAVEQCGASAIYITLGQLTENARAFAIQKNIVVIQDIGIAQLMRKVKRASKIQH